MTPRSDELWVDMTQFDTHVADGVWDGMAPDPDAPGWYADVRTLVHRARGPAEPDELVDEPVIVDTMRRATLGETLAQLPHRPGVRTVGRLMALKAAAATTASVMTMAAAAATTGIVATVAATVVVPAIQERVMPMIGHGDPPAAEAPAPTDTDADGTPGAATPRRCDPDEDSCVPGTAGSGAIDASGEPSSTPGTTTGAAEPAPGGATATSPSQPAGAQEPAPSESATTTAATAPAETTTTTPTTTSAPLPDEAPSPAASPEPAASPGPSLNAAPGATAGSAPSTAASPPSAPGLARRPDLPAGGTAATGSS
ncbi:MAG TPA: hypothetical protein VFH36_17535 [Acidimicrobiales bacterium]|nr:hypothetical protein [Acidimicrobiales bacterium]